ncbi:hypothetical protein C444_07900 [Haloarcula japonica DSM 6131]|uniref:Uncharacterized protein n=1 Tax=Haloarcula japonica (strain ATCC 49778 / DSM 6131 / JCM 7785 / NBRC 101032 / NCIMB 13157 / TR-1) TaxID=1227453 RepID=M0LD57_HALJT|nr:hypothetical protein C444_07900 [Haloarcula japonica DSM 6131]
MFIKWDRDNFSTILLIEYCFFSAPQYPYKMFSVCFLFEKSLGHFVYMDTSTELTKLTKEGFKD